MIVRTGDRAETVIVLAKEPVPGRVKTRLQSEFTPDEAASLAAAALTDTLAAVRASGAVRHVLAWQGDPRGWCDGFSVVTQPAGSLNDRLQAAFSDIDDGRRRPVLLIGMDTPQVTPHLLNSSWGGADAVLGLSEDGGFWAVGFRGVAPDGAFEGVPMSTDRTGSQQLARLGELGLSVALLPPLRDVDLPEDLEVVCARHQQLTISRRYTEITRQRTREPVDRAFDRLYRGPTAESSVAPLLAAEPGLMHVDLERWRSEADMVDQLIVLRCEPPVIDIGCGPGRMVRALQSSGRAVLGIDSSSVAVDESRRGGGSVLHRRITDLLPAEGRWGTALLMDGNIGIGGDVAELLARCRDLVLPGGLVICEVDVEPERDQTELVTLSSGGARSEPFPWTAVGTKVLQRIAHRLDLYTIEEWRADGRAFVTLRAVPSGADVPSTRLGPS